jgi:hypothetical protein
MGDIFSLGFGPFRWVCTSGNPGDLAVTDKIGECCCWRLEGGYMNAVTVLVHPLQPRKSPNGCAVTV